MLSRSMNAGKVVIALAALLAAFEAQGDDEPLMGRVISVSDGDTLTLLVEQSRLKVRLVDIDAPEKYQPYNTRSRASLAQLCLGKPARVHARTSHRYGRLVGQVTCAGTDANSEQVRRGMAWVFDRYAPAKSPLLAVQAEAQTARRGLWADQASVPPWEWRQRDVSRDVAQHAWTQRRVRALTQ